MVEEVAHPALKAMVDTIATGAAGETLEQWFQAFGTDLIHMHFLDGDPYVHNIWGDGYRKWRMSDIFRIQSQQTSKITGC